MKPSLWHIVVLVVVLIIIFGAAKLPDIAKSIGQSAKVFKKEMKELTDDVPPENDEGDESSENSDGDKDKKEDK